MSFRSLVTGLVALAASYVGLPSAAAEQGYGIEEIVVRAQRREETIQDVPIAVSAFDADALDRYQIDTFSDLQFSRAQRVLQQGQLYGE